MSCLPKDLPEYLEVDMSAMQMNEMKRLSDIPLPSGVDLVALSHGRDEPVASIHHPRAEEVEAPVAAASGDGGCAGGWRGGAAAAGAEVKKEEAKPAAPAAPAKGGKK